MADSIRFYLDEHIPKAVAQGLRRRGLDVRTAQEAGRAGFSDGEQLEWAHSQSRVLVTFDDDFLALAARENQHSGIVFCHANKYSVGELIHALVELRALLEVAEMQNHVEFL